MHDDSSRRKVNNKAYLLDESRGGTSEDEIDRGQMMAYFDLRVCTTPAFIHRGKNNPSETQPTHVQHTLPHEDEIDKKWLRHIAFLGVLESCS